MYHLWKSHFLSLVFDSYRRNKKNYLLLFFTVLGQICDTINGMFKELFGYSVVT